MDTTTRLRCPARHEQARHLAAGHEIVALRGTLAVAWLDTSLDWLPQAVREASVTLHEGAVMRLPGAALVRLRGVGGEAEALLVAPARDAWAAGAAALAARLWRRLRRGGRGGREDRLGAGPLPRSRGRA